MAQITVSFTQQLVLRVCWERLSATTTPGPSKVAELSSRRDGCNAPRLLHHQTLPTSFLCRVLVISPPSAHAASCGGSGARAVQTS